MWVFCVFVCFLLKQAALSKAENSFREYNTEERYLKDHLTVCCRCIIQTYIKSKFTKRGKKSYCYPTLCITSLCCSKSSSIALLVSNLEEYVNNHLNQALTSACALLGLFLINKLSAYDVAVSTQFKCQEITGHFKSRVWVD